MNKIFIGLLGLIIISCSIGKQGVFYSEMNKKPTVEITDNMITVKTENSNKNSALLIYDIDYSVDSIAKEINLWGFQALNKDYKNTFEIRLKDLSKKQLDRYYFYWIDPDSSRIQIKN